MLSHFRYTSLNSVSVARLFPFKTSAPANVSFTEPSAISINRLSSLSDVFPLPSAMLRITEKADLMIWLPNSYRYSLGSFLTIFRISARSPFASWYTRHFRNLNLSTFLLLVVGGKLLVRKNYLCNFSFISKLHAKSFNLLSVSLVSPTGAVAFFAASPVISSGRFFFHM